MLYITDGTEIVELSRSVKLEAVPECGYWAVVCCDSNPISMGDTLEGALADFQRTLIRIWSESGDIVRR